MPLTITQLTVSQQLKERTLDAHKESEAILTPKLFSIQNFDDYTAILKMFYGFFNPLEKQIARYITPQILEDVHERRNSEYLLLDLAAIGFSTSDIPLNSEPPSVQSVPQALGALYVLEGSTLGGRMIAKMLMKNSLVCFDESNLRFFNGYKEQTGNKWTAFQSLLNQYEDDAEIIVASANETFECLTKWMRAVL